MKAMFAAFAAMIVITVGAWYVLGQAGFSIEDKTRSDSVRIG